MAARRSQGNRWASQVALDQLLRYNPQRASLAQQIREARETYRGTVSAGRTTARETEAAAQRALPAIQAAYSKADAATGAGATLVSSALAALPGQDTFKAGEASEVQQQIANLATARAGATTAMLDRGVRAKEGAQFSQVNAHQTLVRTLAQLFGKKQALASEEGAFAHGEADKLAQEAEALDQRERGSERDANTSRTNAQEANATSERNNRRTTTTSRRNAQEAHNDAKKHGAHYTAPGVKELTVHEHNSARDTIESIRKEAAEIRGEHQNYNQAKADLLEPIKTKSYSRHAYANNGALRAGLDLAYFGGLGAGTIKQLHSEGLSVGKLGYPVFVPPDPRLRGVRGSSR